MPRVGLMSASMLQPRLVSTSVSVVMPKAAMQRYRLQTSKILDGTILKAPLNPFEPRRGKWAT